MFDELLSKFIMCDMLPVVAALAGSLITGLLALAAARMSMKAARSDRVRDPRREAYTAILIGLKEASEKAAVAVFAATPTRSASTQGQNSTWKQRLDNP